MFFSLMTAPVLARAVLQAGGVGSRMRPLSDERPKHLLPLHATTILERLLRQLIDAGFRDVWIITGYRGDMVEHHVGSMDHLPADLQLRFLHETAPRGDIGSVADLPVDPRPTLTVYGDLVTDMDFRELLEVHLARGCAATLASHVELHQLRFGELIVREDTVVDYVEKPLKRYMICSGVAVLDPVLIPLIDTGRPFGLDELVRAALAQGHRVSHWHHDAWWVDVNRPTDLAEARAGIAVE